MNIKTLKQLIAQGESVNLEFKKSTAQLKSAFETICAFLNGAGGVVLIGVSDDGKMIGQNVTDKTKRAIGNEIARLTPVSDIIVEYMDVSDHRMVIILKATTHDDDKPYTYDGRAYYRIESNTIIMPREHYHYYVNMNYSYEKTRWEDIVLENLTFNDLDHDAILSTLREGVANGRLPENFATMDVKTALKHFGLMRNKNFTNAAVILFGRNPEHWFPQCKIKLVRFQGEKHTDDFMDSKLVYGHAFKLIEEAMLFVNRHLPIASYFPADAVEREDVPLFPIVALREIFANAVCHRDYTFAGGSITFFVYDNRLEIWSYGMFPSGVSEDNVKSLGTSVPRNPRIADVLYYKKVVESVGKGISTIVSECVVAGHPEPVFEQKGNGVAVILYSKQSIGPKRIIMKDEPREELTERQKIILNLIESKRSVTLNEIKANMSNPPSARSVQYDLAKLSELGFIIIEGHGRGARWCLK